MLGILFINLIVVTCTSSIQIFITQVHYLEDNVGQLQVQYTQNCLYGKKTIVHNWI